MPGKKFAPGLDLPITLDRTASTSIYRQLCEQLRRAILDGRVSGGTRLPSTRTLAQALGVSRTVTSSAYDELFAEGYLEGRHGSGTYVRTDLPPLPRQTPSLPNTLPRWLEKAPPLVYEATIPPQAIAFRLGIPSLSSLPLRVWRETWGTVTARLPPNSHGPTDGDPTLRAELAAYLGRSRGLACTPENILITAGATHALDLVVRATLSVGDCVGMEEPGYPSAQQTVLARGGRLLLVPVDENGMQVERLPHGPAAPLLVYTTPSHQYPLGTRLAVDRRLALLTWAQANDSLIIEDDYDSEFRFDALPLPALASLDEVGRVAYIGTFSKVLTPALRVGYLVAPPQLCERIRQLTYLTDEQVSWPLQQMLADFIARGIWIDIFDACGISMRKSDASWRKLLHPSRISRAYVGWKLACMFILNWNPQFRPRASRIWLGSAMSSSPLLTPTILVPLTVLVCFWAMQAWRSLRFFTA
ncbi:GntR family transcriptional regulator [Ktedonobacter sp. SOSP1-85]|nr:GntR family transcriptional regulator [Ktedonobacter sp. SOSP1-85]